MQLGLAAAEVEGVIGRPAPKTRDPLELVIFNRDELVLQILGIDQKFFSIEKNCHNL